ncbi:hypothetical protein [Actinomadura sp. 7K534]|uniref:hypothetical protein n=1 Tax=Actinomadura sp. 7K534 TaxID=2530366 RepID=UPI001049ACAF|nr:hypothetical protein [Actinomadura sp. 7K534]TDB97317.1 hypothetical protein E1266_07165 [Actinomadura sp. 7K534]
MRNKDPRNQEESTAAKYSRLIAELRAGVFEGSGQTAPALRRSAATGEAALADPWSSYTAKIRDEPWDVTDSDIEHLKAAGHSEDEIFEMTVAAAVGVSLGALDAGLRALRDDA